MQKSQCHQAEIPALILSVQTEQKKKRWKETMDWEGWRGGGGGGGPHPGMWGGVLESKHKKKKN